MRLALLIFNWFFSILCFTGILASGFNIPSILLFILGIVSLPLEFISEKWEDLPFYQLLRPVIIGIVFCVLIPFLPLEDAADQSIPKDAIVEQTEVIETTTDMAEEPESEEMTEETTEEETATKDTYEDIAENTSSERTKIKDSIAVADNSATVNTSENKTTSTPTDSNLTVHFMDVGQADATVLVCDGEAMLIDAGNNSDGTKIQLYLNKLGIKSLKHFIITHPDADHIGGADVIITKFPIENVFMSDYVKDTRVYEDVIDALEYKRMKWYTPTVGSTYTLGGATFTVLAPNKKYDDPNEASIALLLTHNENTFLFTGDAESSAESDILRNGLSIDCDVFKAGHHGSKTSNSKSFLDKATPEYVVVSCGDENSYGHPHAEPMNTFRSMGVKLFRTDEQGTIVATSDGKTITWNTSSTDSWKAGESTESGGGIPKTDAKASTQTQSNQPETQSAPEPQPEPAPAPQPEPVPVPEPTPTPQPNSIIANKNSKVFHNAGCSKLPMEKNRIYFNTREEALAAGFDNPCDYCAP